MRSFSISLLDSVGSGLFAANRVGDFENLEIIECQPSGEHFLLMVDGPLAEIEKFHAWLKTQSPVRERVIHGLDPRVLRAHMSLDNARAKNSFYVLESNFVGDLFAAAHLVFEQGMDCVDLRMARGAAKKSYALFTSDVLLADVGVIEALQVRITTVANVTGSLRSFFDLSTKS